MGKINLRTVFVIGFCCISLWAIFFMFGIRTIGAFLFPIILCVVCWGASVLYEKLVDKAGEKKKVVVTMIALLFLGALSVWLFSDGKGLVEKVISFIFPSILGGTIYGGGLLGRKYRNDLEIKKRLVVRRCLIAFCVVLYLLFMFVTIHNHMFGTIYDVLQTIVFGIIFFVGGFIEKLSKPDTESVEVDEQE